MNQFLRYQRPSGPLAKFKGSLKELYLSSLPPEMLLTYCLTGDEIWGSKARSASIGDFFASKLDISKQRSLLPSTA